MSPEQQSSLVRPGKAVARRVGLTLLVFSVLLQLVLPQPSRFGVDGLPGFPAALGFLGCVILVFAARILGRLVERPSSYYPAERLFRGAATPEDPERPTYERIDA